MNNSTIQCQLDFSNKSNPEVFLQNSSLIDFFEFYLSLSSKERLCYLTIILESSQSLSSFLTDSFLCNSFFVKLYILLHIADSSEISSVIHRFLSQICRSNSLMSCQKVLDSKSKNASTPDLSYGSVVFLEYCRQCERPEYHFLFEPLIVTNSITRLPFEHLLFLLQSICFSSFTKAADFESLPVLKCVIYIRTVGECYCLSWLLLQGFVSLPNSKLFIF